VGIFRIGFEWRDLPSQFTKLIAGGEKPMPRALVIGSSGGIGKALVSELQCRGNEVVGLSRSIDGLDVTDEASVKAQIERLQGPFDTVIVATGALSADKRGPEKTLKTLDFDTMAAQFALNAMGPIFVLKHVVKIIPRNRRSVFAALSARVGSIRDNELGGWYSYRASKAALNQLIRTASIELKRTHMQSVCIALHPGTVATEFTRNYPDHASVRPHKAAENLLNVLDQLSPDDTGRFYDWSGKEVPW
jgi:NAD(P)-dependent dehydrogenase (short-subunit alcohol dehydrogenase family)